MRFRDMRNASPKASRRLAFKQGRRCCWCGLALPKRGPNKATREHLVPRSMGGGGGKNLLAACYRCNHSRGSDMTWVLWPDIPEGIRRYGVPVKRVQDRYADAITGEADCVSSTWGVNQ